MEEVDEIKMRMQFVKTRIEIRSSLLSAAYMYDEIFNVHDWVHRIPYIKFPSAWEVSIIPPFKGATVRFRVRDSKNPEVWASVYLDVHNIVDEQRDGQPFWEVFREYSEELSTTWSCGMDETDKLIKLIKEALE